MKRNILNISLVILLLFVMCFQFLPKLAHEAVGIVFCLGIVLHLYWNRGWLRNIRWQGISMKQKMVLIVNLLLVLDLIAVMATGVMISNHLFKGMIPLEFRRNILIHQLHISLPYLMIVLAGLHVGLHWQGIWHRLMSWAGWNKEAMIYKAICFGGTGLVVAGGIYASFLNRVGDRLLMKHIFATEATGGGATVYVMCLVAVWGLYGVIGWAFNKLAAKTYRKASQEIILSNSGGVRR